MSAFDNTVELWWKRVRQIEDELRREALGILGDVDLATRIRREALGAVDLTAKTWPLTHKTTGKMVYAGLRDTAIALANGSHRHATAEEVAVYERDHNHRQKQLRAAARAAQKGMVLTK